MNKTISHFYGWIEKHVNLRKLLIIILVVFCVLEVHSIFSEIKSSYTVNDSYVQYRYGKIMRVPDVPTVNDIAPWMTFNYINFVFKLSPDYLKNTLTISDTRYPNIQIRTYAKTNKIDQVLLIEKIKEAIIASVKK